MTQAGLSSGSRAFLGQLHRGSTSPFTVADAAKVAGVDHGRAARLLRHLAEQGWVTRVQRGLYATVPLEAEDATTWRVDAWAIASAALGPGYVGGWTALHHWDLTDQLFSTTVFVTSRAVAHRRREIAGARFEVRHRPDSALFGVRRIWRENVPVNVSDRERTLVDCLDDPSLGGGLRHTAEALVVYADGGPVAWARLVEYGDRLGNRTAFKRLGFLAETLGVGDSDLIDLCADRVSAGIGKLDPSLPATGSVDTRWKLRINTGVGS